MVVFFVLILLLILWQIRLVPSGFNADYLGRQQSNAIKGIFILVVFIRHIIPYIQNAGYQFRGFGDPTFIRIDKMVGQLLVVMFLFYSGFGVMESIRNKGMKYIQSMPQHRLLNTLLNFDVAVIFFLIVTFALGIRYSLTDILLAFTGWKAVGNSNWYIFVILLCYLAVYLGFRFAKPEKPNRGILSSCIFLLLAYIVLYLFKELWWYNTILAFAAGLLYSWRKDTIEHFVKTKYLLSLFSAITGFLIFFYFPYAQFGISNNLCAVCFALVVVIASMKVKIGNRVLIWLGVNLFPLYIFQRIPMLVFSQIEHGALITVSPYLYIIMCAAVTGIFGWAYRYWQIKL